MQLNTRRLLIFITCAIIYSAAAVQSYKFLGILPRYQKSHFIFGSALMKGLAEKGHQVYVISTFPRKTPLQNYHDVPFSYHNVGEKDDAKNAGAKAKPELDVTDVVLQAPNVQKLLKSKHKFDAVICENFYAEALFGFSEHFKAPLIGLSTHGNLGWTMDLVGSPSPSSYIPNFAMHFTDHMSMASRILNLCSSTIESLYINYKPLRRHAALYKKYFPHLKKDFYAVRNNISIVLVNSNDAWDYPRPYVPAQIAVGGMHIKRQRTELPDDIKEFIRTAEHGVVYFALGAYSNCTHFKATNTMEILRVLRSLKQRVLWKLDDPTFIADYDNVLIRNWFPQQDILAHENVKVFITQGGLLSVTESIYHATPVIGIPSADDQYATMGKAKHEGIGVIMDYQTLRDEDIRSAILHVINNKKYAQRAKRMSALYRDQPMLPLESAVYWVEYVVRHKGAKHLRCAALDLSTFKYYNLDIVTVFVIVLILAVIIFYKYKWGEGSEDY